jgi:hypothetical protein
MAGMRPAGRLRAAVAATGVALLIGGCGGSSTVTPAAYVKSVCLALGNWTNTIQSARVALESAGAATASRPVAKQDYQRFLASLLTDTRRATRALRAAGTPSVSGGGRIAGRLTGAFGRAAEALAKASADAGSIRTDTAADFQADANRISAEITSALEQIARVTPGQNTRLRRAAAKQPACQLLSASG